MISRFPAELGALTLDELDQPDLIRVVHVSKSWRAVALAHPAFYASCVLRNTLTGTHIASPAVIETFYSNVSDAFERDIRIHIVVQYHPHESQVAHAYESGAMRILQAIRLAFPNLVRLNLSVDIPKGALSALRDILQEPAPLLEALVLRSGLSRFNSELPQNFLDGTAPRLRSIHFSNYRALNFAPVFPKVEKLSVSGACDSMSNIGTRFPGLTHIDMSYVEPATRDGVPLKECFPKLITLRFNEDWSGLTLPCLDVAEQTRGIPSITVQFDHRTAFVSTVPALLQCLGASTHLSVTLVEDPPAVDDAVAIRLQSGGVSRTVLSYPFDREQKIRPSARLEIMTVVQSIASRITRLAFDYLLLPLIGDAVLAHLSSLQRIEVDLRRLSTVSPKDRDSRCCRLDVLQRYVVVPSAFESYREVFRNVAAAMPDGIMIMTPLTLVLTSRTPIWFPAHELLALLVGIVPAGLLHNVAIVLEGVVEEPADVRLLRTVFSEVTYVSVVPLPCSSV